MRFLNYASGHRFMLYLLQLTGKLYVLFLPLSPGRMSFLFVSWNVWQANSRRYCQQFCLRNEKTFSILPHYQPLEGKYRFGELAEWARFLERTSCGFLFPSPGDDGVAVVQLLGRAKLFATPWTAACPTCLSFTISLSLLKHMSIESVMPSNHLILCHPLLLLPSIFPSIRVFSIELALPIGWPEFWSFSCSISPSNE